MAFLTFNYPWDTLSAYVTGLLTLPFYIVFACYVCYYIAHCVIDSSRGHRRASDIQMARVEPG